MWDLLTLEGLCIEKELAWSYNSLNPSIEIIIKITRYKIKIHLKVQKYADKIRRQPTKFKKTILIYSKASSIIKIRYITISLIKLIR